MSENQIGELAKALSLAQSEIVLRQVSQQYCLSRIVNVLNEVAIC